MKRASVALHVRDGIARVILARPAARNGLNGEMQRDLSEVVPPCVAERHNLVATLAAASP